MSKGCQFISGRPSADDRCKCGKPTLPGKPYCAKHFARCYRKPESADKE